MTTQRLILDAELDRSVIRGALTTPIGERREFHGWLELNTALEAMLDLDVDHAPSDGSTNASPGCDPPRVKGGGNNDPK
jgi:isocitrate dehydrogenase